MMNSDQGQRRKWKQDWYWGGGRAVPVPALSFPPPRLLAVFAILVLFLWLQSSSNYTDHHQAKAQAQRAGVGLRLLLVALPAVLLFAALYTLMARGAAAVVQTTAQPEPAAGPWGVAFWVVVLLVLVLYLPPGLRH